jgi:hypothetical protein
MRVCRCSGQGLPNYMAAALDTSAVSLPEIEADTGQRQLFCDGDAVDISDFGVGQIEK